MNIEELLTKTIEENLSPEYFEVINESHKHAGHAGDNGTGQTHFKLKVVSKGFAEYGRVQRQMMVNALVKNLFDQGLHALSMDLKTPQEANK